MACLPLLKKCLLIALVCALAAAPAWSASRQVIHNVKSSSNDDEVTHLPGYDGEMPSQHYAGYVPITDSGKRMWYYLALSERDPDSDPLILWLTGGPGCSSLDAFIYEHGPFKFQEAGDKEGDALLTRNEFSWTKVATMLYVDSPVGSGMSYSSDPDDYATDDARTAQDLLDFLQTMLVRQPWLRARELYIAGESYGGVYVPMLAQRILAHNAQAQAGSSRINLVGYITGNGVANDMYDMNGQVEFAYGLGMISPPLYQALQQQCGGNYWNATKGSACSERLDDVRELMYHINPYSVLKDCHMQRGPGASGQQAQAQALHPGMLALRRQQQRRAPSLGHVVPCADRRLAIAWLNRDDVRRALHASSVEALAWTPCSDVLRYRLEDMVDVMPGHRENLNAGLRVLVYSGDHDYVVPFTGTRAWVHALGLKLERQHQPWLRGDQALGFFSQFSPGLTLASVKGAGHMVPQDLPDQALELIRRWLEGGRL